MRKIDSTTKKTNSSNKEDRKKRIEEEINNILLLILGRNDNPKTKKIPSKDKEALHTLDRLLERSKQRIEELKDIIPNNSYYLFLHKKENKEEKINLMYELKEDGISYSVGINYTNNNAEQKTEIKVSVKDEISREISKYNISIKEDKEEKGYIILVRYENKGESVSVSYSAPIKSYNEVREEKLQDFTNAVDKSLELLPQSVMGSVLGFTYLGENYMARRSDLTGSKALMVDVHEAIHTPDEYETRVLVDWMLTREKPKYKR